MANQLDEIIDFRYLFFKIIKNWPLFVISLLLTFSLAFAYIRYSPEIYKVETSFLIKEDNTMPTASDLLYNNMSSDNVSLENKELMLKSYPLIHKTLKDLRFDIGYYIVGNVKVSETFHAPILLNCSSTEKVSGKSFEIEILNENSFLMTDEETSEVRTCNFDEEFIFHDSEMSVSINTN
ncbi:Wzz/FepE/Etk N-terminal domain-containing protein, partial [Flavobacteriales bacterium]|nr:Wzz/FepE/Etk N-terminal domain-containing protein [Flavobacteriales bacterium]